MEKEIKERLISRVKTNPYINFLEIDFTEVEDGRVEARMPLHGFAAYTMLPIDRDVLTADLNISFLRAAWGKELIAKGYVVKPGRHLHFCECEIYCDGKLVSKASGTFCVVHPQI